MPLDYKPKFDATADLETDRITMYYELIGELRWAIWIGRVDILHELALQKNFVINK